MKRRNFIGYSLLFLVGCAATQTSDSNFSSNSSTDRPEKLRLAVTDIQGLEALKKDYEAFRQTLSVVLDTPVEFFPVESYTAAAVAFQANEVDMILTGPSEYVVINSRTRATPIVAIARADYHSLIVVPSNSPVQSLDELKGKTVAMKKAGSTSGHLGPTKILLDAGLQPQTDYTVEMLGFPGGVEALIKGEVDAWGGSYTDYLSVIEGAEGVTKADFRILQEGAPLPSDLIMVSELLPESVAQEYQQNIIENEDQLIEALIQGEETKKYAGSELASAQDSDYDMIREVYTALGEEELIR